MSADNWAVCPKCKINGEAEHAKAIEAAETMYGKVSANEYLKLLEKSKQPAKLDDTLREDYEIGILSHGRFYASYGGSCEVCGFSYSFKHEVNTLPKPKIK